MRLPSGEYEASRSRPFDRSSATLTARGGLEGPARQMDVTSRALGISQTVARYGIR